MTRLTHIDETGRARMVDVSDKSVTAREARAVGMVRMNADTLALAVSGGGKKGEVMRTAELAGVMAAKKTADLIPLCHTLALSKVEVAIGPIEGGLEVVATVRASGQTGVEMEALTAVSVACLTVYDMLKAADKAMVIEGVRVVAKSGGRSGDWTAE